MYNLQYEKDLTQVFKRLEQVYIIYVPRSVRPSICRVRLSVRLYVSLVFHPRLPFQLSGFCLLSRNIELIGHFRGPEFNHPLFRPTFLADVQWTDPQLSVMIIYNSTWSMFIQ